MRYQKIESRIWNDERFVNFTPMQQRMFLYVLTCPHGNLLGLFVLKKGYIIEDLKVLSKDLERDLKELVFSGMIDYDEKCGLVWVKKFLKHNPLTNPNQFKAVPKILNELPKSHLILDFIKHNSSALKGLAKDLERAFEGNPKPEAETATDSEEDLRDSYVPPSSSHGVESKNGNVPYLEIQKSFNEILGEFLPTCNALTEQRKKQIKQRFLTDEKTKTVEWWREQFFPMIAESEFLTGRNGKWTNCSFDWIIKPSNFQKIREGTYNR